MEQSDIQLREVHLTSLIPSDTNPRQHFDQAELQELVASVKLHGILQPILVRPLDVTQDQDGIGQLEIVAGERRYRAALAAGLETVPAKKRIQTNLRHVTDDGEVLVVYDVKKIIEHAQKLGKYNPPDDKASAARNVAGDGAKELWESTGRYVFTMRKRVHAEIISKTPQILAGGAEGLLPLLIKLILEQMDSGFLYVQEWFQERYHDNGNFDPKSNLEAAHCLIDFVLSLEDANYQSSSNWTREFPVLSDIADLMGISYEVSEADRVEAERAGSQDEVGA